MAEILQEIEDFPTFGFFTLFFLLLGSPIIYYLRPRYFPCNYWKVVILFDVIGCLFLAHIVGVDHIVYKEKIESLISSEGILKYRVPQSRQRGGYYLIDSENKTIKWLNFTLCGEAKEYLSKKVIVWRNREIVYQLKCDNRIIFDVDKSNEKVWLLNFQYFMIWISIITIMLINSLALLRVLNNNYKKEVN